MTPEAKVKAKVSELLKRHGVWYDMPVPGEFGKPTLDYIGARDDGIMFAIETKPPGKKPTERQQATIRQMRAGGIACFVVVGEEGLRELDHWLGLGGTNRYAPWGQRLENEVEKWL